MDYKTNSHATKELRDKPTPRKQVDKVVTGGVRTTKKGELRKMFDIFIPDDAPSMKAYIIADVIVPLIKKGVSEIVDACLYPDGKGKKSSTSSRVPYRNYYDSEPDRRPIGSRHRPGYAYDDVLVDDRGEAEEVLIRMDEIIETYGSVSVGDFYDLIGKTGTWTDNDYGWTDLRSAKAHRARGGGWRFVLPKAMPLK